jgi:hexosaminidase
MATAGEYYAVDPAPANSGLSPVETARILGGEACAWGEFVSPDTIDSRIWPRLAAIAERLWSPQETNDVPDMYRRLSVVSTRLEEVGLKHHCNEDRMLGLLFGGGDLSALKAALGAVTPVARDDWELRQDAPLTGLSDAAAPDPELATDFTHLVGGLLKDAPNPGSNRESIARLLAAWQAAAPHATELSRSNPRTTQESTLFQDLSEAARIGREAIQYLSRGASPSPGWRAEQLAVLDRAAQPRAHLRIAILPAVRELVVLASEPAKARTVSFK